MTKKSLTAGMLIAYGAGITTGAMPVNAPWTLIGALVLGLGLIVDAYHEHYRQPKS